MTRIKAPRVRIEGAFFIHHSLANVNRQLALGLAAHGCSVTISPYEGPGARDRSVDGFADLEKLASTKPPTADVIIRHAFPPNLCPTEQPLILMQPWEFFAAPDEWVGFVNVHAAELWVNSSFTRAAYVRSGVDPRKVRALPLGYAPGAFGHNATPDADLNQPDEFRFLYVGGSITRKGLDILLSAYCNEFRRDEAVRLVIKDVGTQHVYSHNNWSGRISDLAADPNAPKITYLSKDVSQEELAGIYAACHCLAAPYRAEGFCLPVLEAMASRLPVIVTQGGPTDDMVLHGCGWKIGSRLEPIEQMPGLGSSLAQAWLEPDTMDLRSAMREAFEGRSGKTRRMGEAAWRIASTNWGWNQVIPLYTERIDGILEEGRRQAAVKAKPTETRISLCMIAKNEERVIEACLRSARPYFDEIILVDTGSTDRTKELAAPFVDKLLDFPWCNDFSAARNVSLGPATGDWVFWMDADDTLPVETGQAIRAAAENAGPEVAAFVIPVQFVEEGSPTGTRVDHVKLFRNGPDMRFEGRIHEQILPSIRKSGGEVHRLDVVVLHSGYDTTAEGQRKKRKRDDTILRLELKERPDHPFVNFNVGMTRHFEGDHKEAVTYLSRCLELAEPHETIVRKAYALLAVSYRELGEQGLAIETVLKGLEVVPGDPELHFHAGLLYTAKGETETALAHYQEVPSADIGNHFSSIDMGILNYKTFHNMGSLCRSLGRFREAKNWFVKAIDSAPEFLPSAFELFDSSLEAGDLNTGYLVIQRVFEVQGPSESWAKMVERHAEAAGGEGGADTAVRACVESHATALGPKLVWVRRLLSSGREQEAIPLLRELAGQSVAEAHYLLGVHHVRGGEFEKALGYMRDALRLNPDHNQTAEQIQNIEKLLSGE